MLDTLAPRQLIKVRPRMLIRRATHRPDLLELVEVRCTAQDRSPMEHLAKDTAKDRHLSVRALGDGRVTGIPDTPQVDLPAVAPRA